MKKVYILFFLLVITISFSYQKVQHYPFDNNLTSLNIKNIFQDHFDLLWLGTDYGIYKFDGENLKFYQPNIFESSSLKGEKINYIFEDSSNRLWVATNLGLNVFNYLTDNFVFFDSEIIKVPILTIEEFNDNLLVGTTKGMFLFDVDNKSFNNVSTNLENFSINDIDLFDGYFWLSTNKGLVKYSQTEDNIEIYSKDHIVKKSTFIKDKVWYITDIGLNQFNTNNSENINYLDNYEFNSFTFNKNEIWLSTVSNKIIKFNTNSKEHEVFEISSPINNVYKDKSDFVWIANKKYGLSRLNINSSFENIFTPQNNKLSSFILDKDSFIWLGTEEGVLKKFNPFSEKWESIETNLKNIKLLSDNNDSILIATSSDLYSFNKKNYSINYISTTGFSISNILEHSNNEFWVASNKGLYLLKNNILQNIIDNINIKNFIKEDEILWIYTDKDLVKYNISNQSQVSYEDIIPKAVSINNMVKMNNKIYFSSDYGIVYFDLDSQEVNYLNTDDGLASNKTKTITYDSYGNIWITTNKGISKYFVFEKRFLNYDLDDGIAFKNFIENAFFNYQDKLYFLAENGITTFYINDVIPNIKFHPIFINSINTENDRYNLEPSETLKINDNSFEIEFSSADYKNKIMYRYKLLNYDKEWKYTDKNSIHFSLIPQGEYRFIIQSIDNSGEWIGNEKVFKLEVSYSIFKTRYAFAFYIISILSFISIFIYFMFLKQKTKNENKTKQLIRQHIEESQENSKYLEKLNKRLEKLSSYDPLTGIQNLRLFDEIIEREWNLAKRKKYPLTLILIDLDYFKNYNDEYGHLKGDEVLVDVAQSLKKCLRRATDHIFRYSGEKFAAILPDTDEAGAEVVAFNMKDAVDKLKIPHIKSEVSEYITVSVGTSTRTPSDYLDIDTFISETENALLEAKEQGRNKIIQFKDKEQGDS